jgi:hypothetical protein
VEQPETAVLEVTEVTEVMGLRLTQEVLVELQAHRLMAEPAELLMLAVSLAKI